MDFRIGQGCDLHRLAEGQPLRIGGVEIPFERGSVAHSDGDVLLHAVTDALLGAIGAGDIGELFPDTDPANQGRDSADFVAEAMGRVRAAGFVVHNLDVTVIAERPKLKPFKPKIRARLAELCACSTERVNVKAKTNESVDAIGAQQAIGAQAVVLLAQST